MKTLAQIHNAPYDKVSDKWSIYLREYDRLFSPIRESSVSLLEIGIQNGGSLERWAAYFEQGLHFIGCDINPDCEQLAYSDPRIELIVGDANQPETIARILDCAPSFGVVIDDGSHTSGDIVRAFANFFPHIINGGMFVAEDLHCSYWKSFEGGLFNPYSSIAFFKRLADVVNQEHWGTGLGRAQFLQDFCNTYHMSVSEELLASIHSVEFINSICVVRKDTADNNQLGVRQVSGYRADVVPAVQSLHGTRCYAPDQEIETSPVSAIHEDWQHQLLQARLGELKKEVTQLKQLTESCQQTMAEQARSVQSLQEQLDAVYGSRSWRMTAGLRRAAQMLRSLFR